jgi:N utilization substance protein B
VSPRRQARRLALDILYQADVTGTDAHAVLEEWESTGREIPSFTRELIDGVGTHLPEIDRTIGASSEGWRVGRMAAVDRSILRLATYELRFGAEVPVAAVIDEAVRAAKELSTEDSGRFVNGVLGKIAGALDPREV